MMEDRAAPIANLHPSLLMPVSHVCALLVCHEHHIRITSGEQSRMTHFTDEKNRALRDYKKTGPKSTAAPKIKACALVSVRPPTVPSPMLTQPSFQNHREGVHHGEKLLAKKTAQTASTGTRGPEKVRPLLLRAQA